MYVLLNKYMGVEDLVEYVQITMAIKSALLITQSLSNTFSPLIWMQSQTLNRFKIV